jgi:hypothetical protein
MDPADSRNISGREILAYRSMASPGLQIAMDLALLTGLSDAELIDAT